ncbi:hypothetical protein HYY74_06910 [Candidatus Woesearchaeota archaeon]|nr:hypothetical protein [Candidatus Woesearchaeota archaeon]
MLALNRTLASLLNSIERGCEFRMAAEVSVRYSVQESRVYSTLYDRNVKGGVVLAREKDGSFSLCGLGLVTGNWYGRGDSAFAAGYDENMPRQYRALVRVTLEGYEP